ncbi:MAG: RHS repeat-associated core domain-containing protein [Acidobacteriota bacterium]
MKYLFRLRFRHWTLGIVSMLLMGILGSAQAHQVIVTGQGSEAPKTLVPVILATPHLVSSPSVVDFDLVVVGSGRSVTVSIVNDSTESITATVNPPPEVSVIPTTLDLAPGAGTDLTLTWQPTAAGSFDSELTFVVDHARVRTSQIETLALQGTAAEPALRFDIPMFSETDVDSLDCGLVGLTHGGDPPPYFEVVVTNIGGVIIDSIDIDVPTPEAADPALGLCYQGADEAELCVGEKLGQLGDGTPMVGSSPSFNGLLPGASVTTVWHVVPEEAGPVAEIFDVAYTVQGDSRLRTQSLDLTAEIIPYQIGGDGFFRANEAVNGSGGLAETVDPLVDDPLGVFRPTSFDARTVFDIGDIDAIDLRTGNLTLMVPIGGPQVGRAGLGYELKAVFNSHIWHRKTIGELRVDPPDLRPEGFNAEYPNPAFNLGSGFAMHLGRLLPPRRDPNIDLQFCNPNPLPLFEKEVDTGPRFVYIDSSGTHHEFWPTLHGSVQTTPFVDPETRFYSYTRDGSYMRMTFDSANPNRRVIEERDGTRHVFVKQATPHPTLPDTWQLQSIEDPYGNKILIDYTATSWTIRDNQNWRSVVVNFGDWPGRGPSDPMRIDSVVLPGFAGVNDRIYDFHYETITVDRPSRSTFHLELDNRCNEPGATIDVQVTMPRITSIILPDGSSYRFNWIPDSSDVFRLDSVELPTGGKVAYEYELVWDSPPDCQSPTSLASLAGVSRRVAYDDVQGTTLLDDRRYLRETLRTDDVPDDICDRREPTGSLATTAPWSEQTVVVWRAQESTVSSATAHYFNIYPYDDDCGKLPHDECELDASTGRYRLKSGRTHLERNLQIKHSVDSDGAGRRLSEEVYACAFGVGGVTVPRDSTVADGQIGDHTGTLLAACDRKETTYADYEVSKAGSCQKQGPHCLRDSRLRSSITTYDDGRWIETINSDYDGLGHFRRTQTRSNFADENSPDEHTRFKNWDATTDTLSLDANYEVKDGGITVPPVWLLDLWSYQWEEEDGDGRGSEVCFDRTHGHVTYTRTWAGTTVDTGADTYGNNRTNRDLVVKNAVTSTGEVDLQRYFGADTYDGGVPTGSNWCNDGFWTAAKQDYAVDINHQFGIPFQKYVVGESVFEMRQTIDRDTGWIASRTLDSGEVLTHHYDDMGRLTWITSPRTASRRFQYQQQGDGTWDLIASVYPKNTLPTTTNPHPIRTYTARYDGLGRVIAEVLPKAGSGTVTRSIDYHRPGNQPRKISSLDNVSVGTTFAYDYRGRLVRRTEPNNDKTAFIHVGLRRTRTVSCVDTAAVDLDTGICEGSGFDRVETKVDRDWRGREIKRTSPEGFVTTFSYDVAGNPTSASRTHNEPSGPITQTRSWEYDGLGFFTKETIPERDSTDYSDFNTRGQAQTIDESDREITRIFDRIGRLRSLWIDGKLIKDFEYCDTAANSVAPCNGMVGANGQLYRATRHNHRDATTSAVDNKAGVWWVQSTYTFDDAGRKTKRDMRLEWRPTFGTNGGSTITQSWSYDDLGNVVSLTYPNGEIPADPQVPGSQPTPFAPDRTVVNQYSRGFYLTNVAAGNLGAALEYHPSGMVHKVVHANGAGIDTYGVVNGMPRIASIDLGAGTPGHVDLGAVSYDWAGNIIGIGNDTFEYDKNSRLVNATLAIEEDPFTQTYSYVYDNFDNHRVGMGTIDPETNRLTGGTDYDDFGNLIEGPSPSGPFYATYDEVDKLVLLTEPSGRQVFSIYDHDDLRVLIRESPGEITWTLRDGLQVVRELVGLGDSIQHRKDYVYAGSRLISSFDGPVNQVSHYHQDQVGNARLITGGTPCGDTAASYCHVDYEPFGAPHDASDSDERAVGFQSHENDGFVHYMRGRTYLPTGARFIQVDPARDASTWSQYGFVANNPMSNVDPTGLSTEFDTVKKVKEIASFFIRIPRRLNLVFFGLGEADKAIDKFAEENTVTVEDILASGRGSRSAIRAGIAATETKIDAIEEEITFLTADQAVKTALENGETPRRKDMNRVNRGHFTGKFRASTSLSETNDRLTQAQSELSAAERDLETLREIEDSLIEEVGDVLTRTRL